MFAYSPANTTHLYNICTMLDQRRRRWADVVQMLYKCVVFAGSVLNYCRSLCSQRWCENTIIWTKFLFSRFIDSFYLVQRDTWPLCHKMCSGTSSHQYKATAYIRSKQLLHFGFAWHNGPHTQLETLLLSQCNLPGQRPRPHLPK